MPTFDRFDICAAYNLYSCLYGWDDYTNGIQSRLAKIKYRPSASDQDLEEISENAQDILLDLVLAREGEGAHDALRREIRPETGDATVRLENSDDDPFQVVAHVYYEHARNWAKEVQATMGSSWECVGDDFAYNIWMWTPNMAEELESDGLNVDWSQYSDPTEEGLKIGKHASDCPDCDFDYHKARKHMGIEP